MAVVVLLYDCIRTWWLWSIVNEDATLTINVKGCTSTNHCAVMLDYRGYTSSYEKDKYTKEKVSTDVIGSTTAYVLIDANRW